MKILFICNASGSILGFRGKLIEKMQQEVHTISAIAFDDKSKSAIEEKGVEFFCLEDKNRGLNPLKILTLKKRYKKLIKQIKPDVVFTSMLKPNSFGAPAAKTCGIKQIYCFMDGAGDVFINNSFKWKIIRKVVCSLYKRAFKCANKVFFLNNDDKIEFVKRKIVKEDKCEVVLGVGIDLERFTYKPIKNHKTFLMIARMLKTKGIYEYCKMARAVKQKYPDATFNYIGAEGTVKLADIQEYVDDGSINYLGTTPDVRPFIEDCAVHVLPSYREGQGQVSVEAGAMGRALIVCDTNGSRDTVKQDYNGFLVPVKDVDALIEKAVWYIENPEKTEEMGKNARKFAEDNFDQKVVNNKIVTVTNLCNN